MKEKLKKIRRRRGFSLVELIVVVALIVIIAGIAVAFIGRSKSQMQRQNVARELKVAFERARFDSVKRRADVGCDASIPSGSRARVVITSTSFTLVTDVNDDGTYTSVANNFGGQSVSVSDDIDNSSSTLVFPITVAFNARGEACTTDNTGAVINDSLYAARFLICNGTCNYGNATVSNSNLVLVTPSGTVNLLTGGSVAPDFDAPDVSEVDDDSLINTLVTLIAGGGSTPIPTPTATPTPDPNATPTPTPEPTPTPTPDPNATPTPTPDPNATPTPTATPTATPTPSPTATPTATPTPTPTPTGCFITSPADGSSKVFTRNGGSGTIAVSYSNSPGSTVTIAKTGTLTSVSPTSAVTLSGSGGFNITVNYPNGNPSGTVTISGCGSTVTVNVSTSN